MCKLSKSLTFTLSLLFLSLVTTTFAQTNVKTNADALDAAFQLEKGDRVLFVGNSLFENDVQFGYLELALTTRWPNQAITYRNIGWSGDNVYGEARSYVTTPPTPYELLIQQITEAKPTVVFVGYGGIEAQEGEEGLARFKQGYASLLDKIDQLGAKAVLVSPIPVLLPASDNTTKRNAALEMYAAAIEQIAKERKKRYLDVFKPMLEISKQAMITENGVHLNGTGYYYLATALEKSLRLPPRKGNIAIDVANSAVESTVTTKLLQVDKSTMGLSFTVNETCLPLPAPQEDGKTIAVDNGRKLSIKGLKKGFYTLSTEDDVIVTASAKEWEEGVTIKQGPMYFQAEELRKTILKKEELFFFQYRPLNQTYIIGFRSYEQGRHKKGLEEQNYLITWLEAQIETANQPAPVTYQLRPLK